MPLSIRVLSDWLTPVMAYRRLVAEDPRMAPSFLLESVVDGGQVGRYSYLGAQPAAEILAYGHRVETRSHRPGTLADETFESADPLAMVSETSAGLRCYPVPGLPEFTGGWVGYTGYDTVRYAEPEKLNDAPPDDRGLPDLHLQLYLSVVAFDHVQKTISLITHVDLDASQDDAAAYEQAVRTLGALADRLCTPHPEGFDALTAAAAGLDLQSPPSALPTSTLGEGGYQQAVDRIKEYVLAGDAFQVVPSQRFERQTRVDPFDIYRSLRVVNPSPYMFYVQVEGAMLVGSSPEILCRVHDGRLINRPLAGTRRRGANDHEDKTLEAELLDDPKDRAEHIMLVDLGRNDVGRVARPGSIELTRLMEVERYSHVMHISSTVEGELLDGLTAWDALRTSLPVGTVSGAPKIRAMQIIDEIEPTRRGPYAGAVGYADLLGNMDMAIALRTMVVLPGEADGTWRVHLQAGGGIVADSDPDAEHQETVNKAAALAKAIDVAEQAFGG
ncbi:Anthranilate synthase component 1 [Mucisphaera calidilacus]|uniref:Anthranilate synthase component 1 n=1 Tax=Mucisphaera calidilacus TaxID=2527982 RepID=A0A518BXM5_9BACT|nr:Anthranilate synthase component 1 [Mucisphaera calidilacus]